MKRWLVVWAPVLAILALLRGDPNPAPEAMLCAAGVIFWGMGVLVAHRTAGRGSLAGLFMLAGLFVSLFTAGVLAGGLGVPDGEALSLTILGLVGGLELALDGASVAVLLLNLIIYWTLVGIAVAGSSGKLSAALVLSALGPPALMLPSGLLAWVRSRRGEHFETDLRRAERILRWGLGLSFLGMMIVGGLTKEQGNPEFWLGLLVVGGLILTGLRKS